jgi:hypothetical protein
VLETEQHGKENGHPIVEPEDYIDVLEMHAKNNMSSVGVVGTLQVLKGAFQSASG